MTQRELAVKIAWRCYGLPYIWGGDDTLAGFDCSGIINEILKSLGRITEKEDYTAHGLYLKYNSNIVHVPRDGVFVFWKGSNEHVRHVELALDDHYSIGASGGGSKVITIEDAIRYNAFVKIRPIYGRGNIKGFIDIFN